MNLPDQSVPRVTAPGSADFDRLVATVEALRNALREELPDTADYLEYGFTAAAMLAGIIYGTAIMGGLESGSASRTKRAAKSVEINFRSGIRVAMRAGADVAAKMGAVQ